MVPNIRGNFEVKRHIRGRERTFHLYLRPLCDADIADPPLSVKVDRSLYISWLIYLAAEEKRNLDDLRLLHEFLSPSEKLRAIEWIMNISNVDVPGMKELHTPTAMRKKLDDKLPKYIKCEYCDSWVDASYINCPNCGAPVKRG